MPSKILNAGQAVTPYRPLVRSRLPDPKPTEPKFLCAEGIAPSVATCTEALKKQGTICYGACEQWCAARGKRVEAL